MTTTELRAWIIAITLAVACLTWLALTPDPLAEPDRAATVEVGR